MLTLISVYASALLLQSAPVATILNQGYINVINEDIIKLHLWYVSSFRHNNFFDFWQSQGKFSILGSAHQTHSLAIWLPVDCALKGMALAAIKMNS